ncbi:pimeloyl-ACP methyl ester carboxylesterase [Pullulanibacillus pueri]|uniref:AB hydrolase-1 domain-containing protein n=1 Tax=Pullulanibacillus pueri TaxID=1437324 RepID=A0A8J3EKP4_9BACL|nr:alpha/beta hydrolase [Pullulanibacillus pueri]MBM7680384.1 pimeloyl-ACP methyl ester carboxylesterase [Pullulanibacillus pueri]GGH75336.1 hypothetical protein GCM10007096_04460 [Pullulanibacillus pueri]
MALDDYFVQKIGRGKPLLFFPAAGFGGLEGLNIAEMLQEEFESHLIDLPGLGRSKGLDYRRVTTREIADWVKRYLDFNHFQKVTIAGHSMGGFIALAFAYHYPECIEHLILLDHGHKKISLKADVGFFSIVFSLINVMEKFMGRRLHQFLHSFFMTDGAEEPLTQEILQKKTQEFCEKMKIEEGPYIALAIKEQGSLDSDITAIPLMLCFSRTNVLKLFHQLSVPTLEIYGTFKGIDDKEAKRTEKWVRKKPSKSFIQYFEVDAGHYVHWATESPLKEIARFLNVSEDHTQPPTTTTLLSQS